MPTRRHPLKRRNVRDRRLTPEIVALFIRLEEIRDAGDHQQWEEHGGRKREYLDGDRELCDAFRLPGHAVSPTDARLAAGEPMPQYMVAGGLCAAETWPRAAELRRQLLAAAAAQAESDVLPAFLASRTVGQK
jgi:hypothetical protein